MHLGAQEQPAGVDAGMGHEGIDVRQGGSGPAAAELELHQGFAQHRGSAKGLHTRRERVRGLVDPAQAFEQPGPLEVRLHLVAHGEGSVVGSQSGFGLAVLDADPRRQHVRPEGVPPGTCAGEVGVDLAGGVRRATGVEEHLGAQEVNAPLLRGEPFRQPQIREGVVEALRPPAKVRAQ